MKKALFFLVLATQVSLLFAQLPDLPQDYLSADFFAGRRDSLRARMPENSVAVIFSYPTRNYSNDVEYVYHANPDMYYFSGYREPNAVLLIFKEEQELKNLTTKEILFVQERNARAEQWTGRRLGADGAKEVLGIKTAFNGSEFSDFPIDFSKFEKILTDELPSDLRDNPGDKSDLYDLIQQFREKSGIPSKPSQDKRFGGNLYMRITAALREIKTEEEITLLRKAVEISCIGQQEVMKAIRPNMSETEIQGLHEYVHKKYGAESVGYPSIVGAGNNGCILHYIDNNKTRIGNQLILMDVGAEYHGYTADVTRTIPANGKFSEEQKIIYNLVYEAQEAAFKLSKQGASWIDLSMASKKVIADGLLRLGIIRKREEVNRYYPHGLGHHIGLDVHDRGSYGELKKGMVITIEPGIYIPDDSPCDQKWWGIAVRIEDDLLIRENDYELLSSFAPRKVEDIEKLIAEKSALDDFILPPLKSGRKGF